jgi:hypothetical protein
MKRDLLLLVLLGAVVCAGGCAGQSVDETETKPKPRPEPSCDIASTPCGGDVVGTWKVMDCPLTLTGPLDIRGFGLGCSFGTTLSGALEVSGTWMADAMGNVWDNTTTRGVHEFSLAAACLEVAASTCNDIGTPLRNTYYDTAECIDAPTGGCTCSGTFNQQGGLAVIAASPPQMGTYSVAGSSLTTSYGGTETTYEYCVMDDALVLTVPTQGSVGFVGGSIVLQKE